MPSNCGAGEDPWESLDRKEIKPVSPKGNQPWMFIGRTDTEAESNTLITWCEEPTHCKRPWCWESLRAGGEWDDKGWDRWHNWLSGHEFEQTLGDSEGQGSLMCYSLWNCKKSDTT